MLPSDYELLGKQVGSSLAFISNITYWYEAGYFDTSAYGKWLLHTWSLSVEWQFYIIYPLVILTLYHLVPFSWIRKCLVILVLLSLSISIYASIYWPSSAFYLLPTRAWEILAGGLIYLFPINLNQQNKLILESIGLVLILFGIIHVSSQMIWSG